MVDIPRFLFDIPIIRLISWKNMVIYNFQKTLSITSAVFAKAEDMKLSIIYFKRNLGAIKSITTFSY